MREPPEGLRRPRPAVGLDPTGHLSTLLRHLRRRTMSDAVDTLEGDGFTEACLDLHERARSLEARAGRLLPLLSSHEARHLRLILEHSDVLQRSLFETLHALDQQIEQVTGPAHAFFEEDDRAALARACSPHLQRLVKTQRTELDHAVQMLETIVSRFPSD